MDNLPNGIVTFLFTDIEASTKLWEAVPDKMKVALQRHHAILQETIESNRGIVFQIIGDAFCAAFPAGPDAISAALKAQYSLHEQKWDLPYPIRVRMGIHTGEAEPSSRDSLTGGYASNQTLNRVARIMSAGHGGQILLSQSAAASILDHLPSSLTLRDMGKHRMKGLSQLEHLFQLEAPDLPVDFPQLNTLDISPNNLPVQLTSFIGREKEIADVKRLLSEARLVTLTGSGGCGKTRLSIQVATELQSDYSDGVWVVELAPLADPALVTQTVASTLNVREEGGRPLMATLVEFLHNKQYLLVLDNCEHLIEACAQLSQSILHACPKIHILASSRESLGISGEVAYRVPSFEVPDQFHLLPADAMPRLDAVRLFFERAVTTKPSFTLTQENLKPVVQICRQLDGIPLAIELAAARVRVLSVEQISARLDDRFHLLTGGSRTALPRHQTLRAMIDWSYSLLPEKERILFRRLSAFVGGWTLEAAEAVCADSEAGGLPSFEILDLLTRLVDKSLVMTEEDANGEIRYRRLETIRQYAQEKFLESEDVDAVRNRHLMWHMQLAERAEPKLEGGEQDTWARLLETEHDNMRAALQWAMKQNGEAAVRLAGALGWFWMQRSFLAEGRAWLEQALASSVGAPSALRVRVQAYAAGIAVWQGDAIRATSLARAMLQIEKSLSVPGETENKLMMMRSLFRIGLAISLGENIPDRAISIFQRARALAEKAGDVETVAASLLLEGNICISEGRHAEAKNLLEKALSRSQAAQTRTTSSVVLYCLIGLALIKGDIAEAQAYYKMLSGYLRTFSMLGDLWVFHGTEMEGRLRVAENDLSSAQSLLAESLKTWQEARIIRCIPHGMEACASLALAHSRVAKAVKLLSASEAIHIPRYPVERALYEHTLASARTKLDPSAFDRAWTEGQNITVEEAVALALQD